MFAAWLDPVSLARWLGTGEGADVTAGWVQLTAWKARQLAR